MGAPENSSKELKDAALLENQSQQVRVEWIDVAKGLGIILVILGHTHALFRPYIYSFHMPLVFYYQVFLRIIPV